MMKRSTRKIILLVSLFLASIVWIVVPFLNSTESIRSRKSYVQNLFDSLGAARDYCDYPPKGLKGSVELNVNELNFTDVIKALSSQQIKMGGHWKPENCTARHRVAILIPFRNRTEHLNCFLLNMHPIFARQQIEYKIYLIEPIDDIRFNRGLLFNIGFQESNRDYYWDCHAYHDVDLLLEDDRTLYTCPPLPTHLAHFQNKWNYSVMFPLYFGGATIMKKEQFRQVNGFSNIYFGWGAEDDDHRRRIMHQNLSILNPEKPPIGQYYMFKHSRNDLNPYRNVLLRKINATQFDIEGLNTLKYEVIKTEITPLYTKYLVYYNQEEYMKQIPFNLTVGLQEEAEYWIKVAKERLKEKEMQLKLKHRQTKIRQ